MQIHTMTPTPLPAPKSACHVIPRNILSVLNAIVDVAPDLLEPLKLVYERARYLAPEAQQECWHQAANVLEKHAANHPKADQIQATFSGKPCDAEQTTRFVWCAEAPDFPGYYAAKEPQMRGKLGEKGAEVGTYAFSLALHFATRAECETWIAKNSPPAWKPTEHGICATQPQSAPTPPPTPSAEELAQRHDRVMEQRQSDGKLESADFHRQTATELRRLAAVEKAAKDWQAGKLSTYDFYSALNAAPAADATYHGSSVHQKLADEAAKVAEAMKPADAAAGQSGLGDIKHAVEWLVGNIPHAHRSDSMAHSLARAFAAHTARAVSAATKELREELKPGWEQLKADLAAMTKERDVELERATHYRDKWQASTALVEKLKAAGNQSLKALHEAKLDYNHPTFTDRRGAGPRMTAAYNVLHDALTADTSDDRTTTNGVVTEGTADTQGGDGRPAPPLPPLRREET